MTNKKNKPKDDISYVHHTLPYDEYVNKYKNSPKDRNHIFPEGLHFNNQQHSPSCPHYNKFQNFGEDNNLIQQQQQQQHQFPGYNPNHQDPTFGFGNEFQQQNFQPNTFQPQSNALATNNPLSDNALKPTLGDMFKNSLGKGIGNARKTGNLRQQQPIFNSNPVQQQQQQYVYPGGAQTAMYQNQVQPTANGSYNFSNNPYAAQPQFQPQFYQEQSALVYPGDPNYPVADPAYQTSAEGIYSTQMEVSQQKFQPHHTNPELNNQVLYEDEQSLNKQIEPVNIKIERWNDDQNSEYRYQQDSYEYTQNNRREKHSLPGYYDFRPSSENGPLANTKRYLESEVKKSSGLNHALKLDNKMNDLKYNQFAECHHGPKVINRRGLSIWEIDQLINEKCDNNSALKDELNELFAKKYNFIEE